MNRVDNAMNAALWFNSQCRRLGLDCLAVFRRAPRGELYVRLQLRNPRWHKYDDKAFTLMPPDDAFFLLVDAVRGLRRGTADRTVGGTARKAVRHG